MLPEGTAVQPGAVRITDGADVGRVGLVGVVVEEEPLQNLGWWRLFEKEEEEGSMGIENRAPGNDGRAVPHGGWAGEGKQHKPPTAAELAEWEQVTARATAEPWVYERETQDEFAGVLMSDGAAVEFPESNWPQDDYNGEFIAVARAAMPRLLAEVARLRKAAELVKDCADRGYLVGDMNAPGAYGAAQAALRKLRRALEGKQEQG